MAEIEVYTERYEREHGHKPVGRRFWSFTIVSPIATAKDHFLHTEQAMTYDKALEKAMEVAIKRRSERIIVEP
ncbi:hypothetical protein [Bradyrhizobium elkanii]